uniref:Uncharacterized protein n=2 Tax=Candidatus Kentrum sp. SD TaxID=2126332 RepID=A0A450YVJ0_9GAMM|nr:MAG: hypothetical protein BECKSD772F_GA0070984_12341 [Candidatus Kentron sp. SD]
MSERGNNNTPGARNGNGDIPERQGKGGRVLAWCKRNADYLMLFAALIIVFVLFLALPEKPHAENELTGILQFVSYGFVILTISLFVVWFFGIMIPGQKDIDLDALVKNQFLATLTILGMITVLSIVSLIVWAVTQSGISDYRGSIQG